MESCFRCGRWKAASWAWWNAWNPTNGKTIFRNCWLSNETMKQLSDKESEWHEIFSKVASREHRLEEKLKKIMNMKVEDYLKKARKDNKYTIKNLQKMIKKAQKAEKKS